MIKDFDITKTKLVIWDLDGTFWHGTLSEGNVTFIPENLQLVQELTTRGIMNSICSKNDYTNVKTEFVTNGYYEQWQKFVFPSIDWTPKGQRVKNLIEAMQLREENVIIIDDNVSNINEIKFYCPKIMSAYPEQINTIAKELYLVNSYDFEHTRLKSYKILERKQKEKLAVNCSNEEFLRKSEIKICIKHDCQENIDRIEELIRRTNQLNFTKKRIDKTELENIFSKQDVYESAYIIVCDKYGNYGISGFYVLNKQTNELEHFLFSCRIMNMGVEQFLYEKLNHPKIDIVFPVSSSLNLVCDWIEVIDNICSEDKKEEQKTSNLNILFKGMCDLYSTICYINGDCNIDTEFPYWNKDLVYISSHAHPAFIEQTNRLPMEELLTLSKEFPYPHPDEFKTEFFNPKYDVIILSILQATYLGMYIDKNNGHYMEYGYANCDVTNKDNWDRALSSIPEEQKEASRKILEQFSQKYNFAGDPPVDLLLQNLKYIRETLKPETRLILILGSEIDTQKCLEGYEGMVKKHIIVNPYVREFAKKYDNIDIIELTDLIQDDSDYSNCINHFSRRIYINLAEKIINLVNSALGEERLILKKGDD